jgi:hypothetical protein
VLGWRVAVVLIGGLAAFAASAIAARTNLVISGGFHTTSSRAVVWSEQGCGYRSNGTLLYQSNPLRVDRGSAVARVEFFIRRYRGPRRYDARAPAPYGRTAVQVVTARNATTVSPVVFTSRRQGASPSYGQGTWGNRATAPP